MTSGRPHSALSPIATWRKGTPCYPPNPAQADKDFIRAWRLYSFGRWPVPASSGKKRAYAKALEAFLAHAKMMDPPLEVLHIPFEGSEIVGYLRLPKNAKGPVPMIIAISAWTAAKKT